MQRSAARGRTARACMALMGGTQASGGRFEQSGLEPGAALHVKRPARDGVRRIPALLGTASSHAPPER